MGQHHSEEGRRQDSDKSQHQQVWLPRSVEELQVSATISPSSGTPLTPMLSSNVTSAEFVLNWNVMPYVGVLAYGEQARTDSVAVPLRAIEEKGAGKGGNPPQRLPY